MGRTLPRWLAMLSLLLALIGGLGVPRAAADQRDPRLEGLFEALQTAGDPLQARIVEQQIWTLWSFSPDDTVNLLMLRGVDALNQQDMKTALAVFTEMVGIAPDFAEGWNKRATVLYLVGAYEAAIADIDRTLELEPRHFGALSGLGLCNVELARDEAALDAFERALALNPHLASVRAHAEALRQRIEGNKI